MRQPALLQVTSLLLLLLGCERLPGAYNYSPGHSISLPECVKRNCVKRDWFCPQCKQFKRPYSDSCNRCAGKREYTEQFFNQETAALTAHLKSILEQVKKDDWADFLTQYQDRNWICNRCMYYNNKRLRHSCYTCSASKLHNQAAQEQASLVACLTHLLGRLREDGIALPSSQKSPKSWVCFICHRFNVAGEHTCKGCSREYQYDPWFLKWEQTAFMAYVANVVSRFEEDQTAWRRFSQHEPSGATPDLDPSTLFGVNWEILSEAERNAWLAQQIALLAAYNQNNQPSSNSEVPVHQDWAYHNPPKSNSALQEEKCPICFDEEAFKNGVACQCPRCKNYICKECFNSIVRVRGVSRNIKCPFCRTKFLLPPQSAQ